MINTIRNYLHIELFIKDYKEYFLFRNFLKKMNIKLFTIMITIVVCNILVNRIYAKNQE